MAYVSLSDIPVGYEVYGDEPGDGELICFNCAVELVGKGRIIKTKTLNPDDFIVNCAKCGGYHIG